MNAGTIAYNAIKAKVSAYDNVFLRCALTDAATMRGKELSKAHDNNDYTEVQSLNLIISALIEAATDRYPDLDEAINEWVEYDYTGRTMADFVIDWMHDNK